jgi:hypothetical protein
MRCPPAITTPTTSRRKKRTHAHPAGPGPRPGARAISLVVPPTSPTVAFPHRRKAHRTTRCRCTSADMFALLAEPGGAVRRLGPVRIFAEGLPVGLQVAGRRVRLRQPSCAWRYAYEQATPWRHATSRHSRLGHAGEPPRSRPDAPSSYEDAADAHRCRAPSLPTTRRLTGSAPGQLVLPRTNRSGSHESNHPFGRIRQALTPTDVVQAQAAGQRGRQAGAGPHPGQALPGMEEVEDDRLCRRLAGRADRGAYVGANYRFPQRTLS